MKKGLGRGFDSLIPTDVLGEKFDPTAPEDEKVSQLKEIKLTQIQRDASQPRQHFDERALMELSASIKRHGVLQPIVVAPIKGVKAKYQVVAGERRFRAARLAGLETIPALVRTLSNQNRLELSIIENAQREDLCAIELATAYAKLQNQFNLDAAHIAGRVGKSEITIINTLRLLNLPDFAKQAMLEHRLTERVMRPLVTLDDKMVKKLLKKILEEGWGAARVEQYVAAYKPKSSIKSAKRNLFARDERKLVEKYDTDVQIRGHSVRFICKTDNELKKLLKALGD